MEEEVRPVPPLGRPGVRYIGGREKGRGTRFGPRKSPYVEERGDGVAEEQGTVESEEDNKCNPKRSINMPQEPPTPPTRHAPELALHSKIERAIEYEYALFQLRASRLKLYQRENSRLAQQDMHEKRRRTLNGYYARQQLLHEQHPLPPAEASLGLLQRAASAGSAVHERLGAVDTSSCTLLSSTAEQPEKTGSIRVEKPEHGKEKEIEEEEEDPLANDIVWKRVRKTIPKEAEREARYQRMQEIISAARTAQRRYTTGITTELRQEEHHDTLIAAQLRHRRVLEDVWREQVEFMRAASLKQQAVAEIEETMRLQVELKLTKPLPPPKPPAFSKDDSLLQQANWQALFADSFSEEAVPPKCISSSAADVAMETRRWISVWRQETDVHHVKVTKIQCAWRSHAARARVKRYKLIRSVHQRAYLESEKQREEDYNRMITELRWNYGRRSEVRMETAFNTIQRFFSVCYARIQKSQKRRLKVARTRFEAETHAATRIQAAFRGMQGRRRVHLIRNPNKPQWWHNTYVRKFCVAIQRWLRGQRVRKAVTLQRTAARTVQQWVRRWLAVLLLRRLRQEAFLANQASVKDHAALVIQRNARTRWGFGPSSTYRDLSPEGKGEESEALSGISLKNEQDCPPSEIKAAAFRRKSTIGSSEPLQEFPIGGLVRIKGLRGPEQRMNGLVGRVLGRHSGTIGVDLPRFGKLGFRKSHLVHHEDNLASFNLEDQEGQQTVAVDDQGIDAVRGNALKRSVDDVTAVLGDGERRVVECDERYGSVLAIQCCWRTHVAQRTVNRKRVEQQQQVDALRRQRLDTAAQVLQAAMKIPAAKRELQRRRELRVESDLRQLRNMRQRELNNAAQAIQCCWWRHRARRVERAAAEERKFLQRAEILEEAVCMIQSLWKGYRTRAKLGTKRSARSVAQVIIRFFRNVVLLKARRDELTACLKTMRENRQAAYRAIVETEAVLVIQGWWRCCICRRCLEQLLRERDNETEERVANENQAAECSHLDFLSPSGIP